MPSASAIDNPIGTAPGFALAVPRDARIFGEIGINIAAQYLQTNAEIGYVVIDLDAEHSQVALERLRGSARARLGPTAIAYVVLGVALVVAHVNEQPLSLIRRSGFDAVLGEDAIVPTVAAAFDDIDRP